MLSDLDQQSGPRREQAREARTPIEVGALRPVPGLPLIGGLTIDRHRPRSLGDDLGSDMRDCSPRRGPDR